jgi:hypothetical protein
MESIGAPVTANMDRNHCGTYISVVTPREVRWDDRDGRCSERIESKA